MVEPTVEAPEVEQPAKEVKKEMSQEEVESIISQLEAANVSTPQDLQGKLEASRQAGQTANLLGEARNEIRALREEMSKLQIRKPDTSFVDEFDQSSSPPVDLERSIERGIKKVLTEQQQLALEAQRTNNAKWNAIVSDPNYSNVKDVWENKLKDPNFVYQVQNGLVDPGQAYNSTVLEFYKGMLKRSSETIRALSGKTPAVLPPHVEGSSKAPAQEKELPEYEEKIKKTREAVERGKVLNEDEELAMIDAILGTDKPII